MAEKRTKTMVTHSATPDVIAELKRRGFTVTTEGRPKGVSADQGGGRLWIKANVHGNRLATIEREVKLKAKTVDEIVRPKPLISVEAEDNRVMTAVKVLIGGVSRVVWRTTTATGAHSVADFLDANPSVARKAWDMDGSGK